MNKKYRLVIPDKIDKKDSWKATDLMDGQLDGDIICETFNRHKFTFSDIPKEWLQEIKQPETFDEWFDLQDDMTDLKIHECFYEYMRLCYEWTTASERKRAQPVIDAGNKLYRVAKDVFKFNWDTSSPQLSDLKCEVERYLKALQQLQQLKEQDE